ncbi:hypothetical protein OG195_37905 [Streptomyces sp. NBC_01362]
MLEADATASVDSVADSYDNAMTEASTARSILSRSSTKNWRDADQIERTVVQRVSWFNTERLHSALDHLPPEEFEADATPGDHEHHLKPKKPDATKLGTAQ